MRKNARGFTIIELLVVIAVIGILTAISVFSFSKYQANARDSQRSAKATVIAEALEKYYDHNGEYPSCNQITQSATIIRTSVLPGIDPLALLTPKSATGDTNSIKCIDITGANGEPDVFAYVGDGSTTCSTGTGTGAACLQWTLKYHEEGSGNIISIQSRRKTLIATSGTSTINATPADFTQINLGWTPVSNSVSYTVERATNAGFTAGVVDTTYTTVSAAITGLTYNTTYYFKVAPNSASSQGNWSSTASAATWSLGTTSIGASSSAFTSFDTSWGAVTHASNYTVQLSSDGTTWSTGWQRAGIAGLSSNFGGAAYGTKYYVRVQAVSGIYAGGWSNVANATTWSLATPSTSAVATSNATYTSSWGAIAHAASYNAQCSWDGSTWSGCLGSTVGLSFGWGPTNQGTRLWFRTQAVNGPYTSAWSNVATAMGGIDNPAAYSMDYGNTSATWNFLNAVSNAVCPAGTSPSYDWYYNGSNFWVSGTQYRSVAWQYSDWDQSITLSVASRCVTAYTGSGFVWANNSGSGSLVRPTVWVNLPGDSVMYWGGTCPTWTTGGGYNWWTNGRIGASGNGWGTQYGPPGTWWGDGNAHVQLSCDGPWGRYTVESTGMYGPGCNTATPKPECYY